MSKRMKQVKSAAASEINPALYFARQREIRRRFWGEIAGLTGLAVFAVFAVAFWLAYEGIITPEMFK